MPPVERILPRFAAEPPQDELPYGRWAQRLADAFLAGVSELDTDGEDIGRPEAIVWYPDRSWHGRTYVPATCSTSTGHELFGYVRFIPAAGEEEPRELAASVDFTSETAERNPQWTLDLCEEVVGTWRGQLGAVAAMTLVWGRPLVTGGRLATAELADLTVDQCDLVEERFTLLAPDDYRGDLLDIKLYDVRGREIARESLYAADGDGDQDAEEDEQAADAAAGE